MYYTIEPDRYGVLVYEWGIYERSSVLAGQERKTFMDGYDSVEDALKQYPSAQVLSGSRPAHNSVMHLPGEMNAYEEEGYFYPDDY
jgi:cell division protein YceG involved in septum cleavage